MHAILLVGANQILLDTRAAVLRTTGAEVLSSAAESALAIQAKRICDLVVLCHSLGVDECDEIARAIRAGWPKTRIVQIIPSEFLEHQVDNNFVDFISSAQPARLVALTSKLLQLPFASPAIG